MYEKWYIHTYNILLVGLRGNHKKGNKLINGCKGKNRHILRSNFIDAEIYIKNGLSGII